MKNYKNKRINQPDRTDTKFCFKCQTEKSLASFNNDKARKDGKYPYCRACRKKFITKSKEPVDTGDLSKLCEWCDIGIGGTHANRTYCSDPCKAKGALARSYGLSISEYKQLIHSMMGKCPICRRKVKVWHMDHNHETHETFGPVCTTCNTKLLAWTFHDPKIAKRLVEFIENPPVRKMFGKREVTSKRKTNTKWQKAQREARAAEGIYDFPHGLKRAGER